MLQTYKSQLKTYAKQLISTYRQTQALKYFFAKTTQYLALHENLKPLPQAHTESVLSYWSRFLRGGASTQEASPHT